MNEKEAREIIKSTESPDIDTRMDLEAEDVSRAESYLEAIEKAKGVVEALEKCCAFVKDGQNNAESFSEVYSNVTSMKNKALAKWEKEK